VTCRFLSRLAVVATLAFTLPGSLVAEVNPGSYLAARQASLQNDYEKAAEYFLDSLKGDPNNPGLIDGALFSLVCIGDFERALPLAQRMQSLGLDSQIANMVLTVHAAETENWSDIFAQLEANRTIGPLVDGLDQAWAFVGEGRMTEAVTSFDEVIDTAGLSSYGSYHKALALASVGDFEGAEAIFSGPSNTGIMVTRRAAIAHVQVLSQLGRNADALALLDRAFGPDAATDLARLRAQLTSGQAVPFEFATEPKMGLAEVFFTVAGALNEDSDDSYTLLYARTAQRLDPTNPDAIILTAQVLERLKRYDLANAVYATVPRDDPSFYAAELGRAEVLRQAGRIDAAIEVMQQLTRDYPAVALVHASLGDLLRMAEDLRGANAAYSRALELYGDTSPTSWYVHYTRGIVNDRLGEWEAAEADFRKSLALNPGQPQVLNYLGYSMVEKQVNLDEALSLIEQAVAAQPDSGAIVDSLGWVYYRLGRYEEAIVQMERAAELEPVDPVVNDHLGDVLWAVGRQTEAVFQWQRALSFGPEEVDATRIRNKLSNGLDAVLAEEGAPPLRVANGGQ
jgi:tetratricopeptide (TPR) repeat protein